jgi:hypothetical protein
LGPRSTGFQYQTGGGDAGSGARRLSLAGQGRCAEDREHAGAAAFPFPILGIDSDNGSKFINWEPFRWCEQEKRASPTEAAARERFGEFEAKWATKYPGDRPALAQRPFP